MSHSPDTNSGFDVAWTLHRAYLVDMAFRMLRDVGEAEDVVQAAYSQLLVTGPEQIDDARAWLTVVTSRLCLNRIQSAARQRERVADPNLLPEAATSADPADRVTLDDRIRLALLVVLERLTPAERVAFVLHDIFSIPFESVAQSLGRTPAGCRQLASRARKKVEKAGAAGTHPATIEHRELIDRFIAACAGGSFSALVEALHPDVSGDSDYGPLVITGAAQVATNLLRYWSGQPDNFYGEPVTAVSLPMGSSPALLGYAGRRLVGLMLLGVADHRVRKIHVIGNRQKLAVVSSLLHSS